MYLERDEFESICVKDFTAVAPEVRAAGGFPTGGFQDWLEITTYFVWHPLTKQEGLAL
jgi:hypothetical protein